MSPSLPAFSGIRAKRKYHKQASKMRMIADFFLKNPGEYLTHEDVQAKFDVPAATAKIALKRLYAEGLLESVRVIRLKSGAA